MERYIQSERGQVRGKKCMKNGKEGIETDFRREGKGVTEREKCGSMKMREEKNRKGKKLLSYPGMILLGEVSASGVQGFVPAERRGCADLRWNILYLDTGDTPC